MGRLLVILIIIAIIAIIMSFFSYASEKNKCEELGGIYLKKDYICIDKSAIIKINLDN